MLMNRIDLNSIQTQIKKARRQTLKWIQSMQIDFDGVPLWRESEICDPAQWPGMVLPGTYNIVLCSRLIEGETAFSKVQSDNVQQWINHQRYQNGSFWLKGMTEQDIYKKSDPSESKRYVAWHVTNYALGAIEALNSNEIFQLDFARPYLNRDVLDQWLLTRDLQDPWQEGNNIVNLSSFLLLLKKQGTPVERKAADLVLDHLLDWHLELSHPETGFWGENQNTSIGRLHAMAGATHNYHLFYELDIEIPYHKKAIDYCLSLEPTIYSACIDADLIDILAHATFLTDYRQSEIHLWLGEMAEAILAIQNTDGGFPDELGGGTRYFDGWRSGYSEPQGISCAFGTYFRWIGLSMISRVFWPDSHSWGFRKMLGLGYFKFR